MTVTHSQEAYHSEQLGLSITTAGLPMLTAAELHGLDLELTEQIDMLTAMRGRARVQLHHMKARATA